MKTWLVFIITLCLVILTSQFALADDEPGKASVSQLQPRSARTENVANHTEAWDVVVLKNGNRIEGLIIEEDENKAVVERPSARKDRFYTAAVSKNDIAEILRLAPELRTSLRKQRTQPADQARHVALTQAARRRHPSPRPIETRGYLRTGRARQSSSRAAMAAVGGVNPVARSAGAFGGGGRGGLGGGGLGGFGGGGLGGFGGGGLGGGGLGGVGGGGLGGGGLGGGGRGGMGGGMGGGGVTFSNIMQLFTPVNHALVGEVEPVIGLTGQINAVAR